MKQLCSEPDCFRTVTIDDLTERYKDGSIHPLALKCGDCTTSSDIKRLKQFRKGQRK